MNLPFFGIRKNISYIFIFCFQLQRSDSCFWRKSPTSGESGKVGLCALRGWNHEKCGQRNSFFRDSSGIQGHWSLPKYRPKAYVKVFVTKWFIVPPFLVCIDIQEIFVIKKLKIINPQPSYYLDKGAPVLGLIRNQRSLKLKKISAKVLCQSICPQPIHNGPVVFSTYWYPMKNLVLPDILIGFRCLTEPLSLFWFRGHTVILPDWTFKKWGFPSFAFKSF